MQFKVYNPCWQSVNCAHDWGFTPDQTTTDLETALAQPYRVAAVRPFYNCAWIFSYDALIANIQLDQFDLVLISDPEYFSQPQIEQWCRDNRINNYLIALGGTHQNNVLDPGRMLYRNFYIERFVDTNTFVDTRNDHKHYMFDALLGARRPNRDYVILGLAKNNLLDQCIVTYRDCFPGGVINHQNQEFAEIFKDTPLLYPYVSPHLDPAWEVAQNINNQISFIVPERIYQRTYYSILTETLGTGGGFFMSEKSIKALFAKRIFVLFGNQHHLKRLRDQGFQTFGSVIDESYDNSPLDFERFDLAMQQVVYLSQQDPVAVQNQLQSVLDHNHARLLEMVPEVKHQMQQLFKSAQSLE
jgi:hypothetical protein